MRKVSNILLTGLVITKLIGADVIIDPYEDLEYDDVNVYILDENSGGIKSWGPDNTHYEAEKKATVSASPPIPIYIWEKRLMEYLTRDFR